MQRTSVLSIVGLLGLVGTTLAATTLAATSTVAVSSADSRAWQDYLVPLPKQIEIDRKLFGQAQRRLQAHANIDLRCGDFLRSSLPKHTPYKVFANIPFSITTQIIRKLTETCHPPTDMWLVRDKGAAKCCLGEPRETQRSLLLKPNWNLRIVYHFRKEDFHPHPSVDSVLVHFSRKQQPDIQPEQWKQYERFVHHGLQYGFWGGKSLLSKKQVSRALQSAGYPPEYQDGLLLYVQWLCLFRCWQRK